MLNNTGSHAADDQVPVCPGLDFQLDPPVYTYIVDHKYTQL